MNLFRAGGVDPAPVEPTVDFQSPYLVVLSYSNIDYRINEVFEGLQVRIARGGVILAAEEINFYVGGIDMCVNLETILRVYHTPHQ